MMIYMYDRYIHVLCQQYGSALEHVTFVGTIMNKFILIEPC